MLPFSGNNQRLAGIDQRYLREEIVMKEGRPLVLVVEDDALQRVGLVEELRQNGADVIACESAEAGELLLARTGTELSMLVTDQNLAGVSSGAELAAYAHEKFPDLPVVLTSGNAEVPVPDNVVFLRKPFRFAEVLRHIARVRL
jgi:FixJ family two-component response regulator